MSINPEQACSVSQLTQQIKAQLNRDFGTCCVRGELSDVTLASSGHIYFSIKDANAKLAAVMWRNTATRLAFQLKNGMEVVCLGGIDVYPPRGSYQLTVREIMPLGAGSLQLAFQQLQARLEAAGWFAAARKRAIPRFPKRIAVVTSPQGAAIRDFLQVIERRWPHLEILVCPTRVQGQGAAQEIAASIDAANRVRPGLDLIVLCRGGGSLEDLWCFNEMPVCQAVFHSRLPIVTGIGHEVDVTLADLIADQRALTPTEAAERIVPDVIEVRKSLADQEIRLRRILKMRWQHAKSLLSAAESRPVLRRPLDALRLWSRKLDDWEMQMRRRMQVTCDRSSSQLTHLAQQLEALSPLSVLSRGYSVTQTPSGRVVRDARDVAIDEELTTRLQSGRVTSRVVSAEWGDSPAELHHKPNHSK